MLYKIEKGFLVPASNIVNAHCLHDLVQFIKFPTQLLVVKLDSKNKFVEIDFS